MPKKQKTNNCSSRNTNKNLSLYWFSQLQQLLFSTCLGQGTSVSTNKGVSYNFSVSLRCQFWWKYYRLPHKPGFIYPYFLPPGLGTFAPSLSLQHFPRWYLSLLSIVLFLTWRLFIRLKARRCKSVFIFQAVLAYCLSIQAEQGQSTLPIHGLHNLRYPAYFQSRGL